MRALLATKLTLHRARVRYVVVREVLAPWNAHAETVLHIWFLFVLAFCQSIIEFKQIQSIIACSTENDIVPSVRKERSSFDSLTLRASMHYRVAFDTFVSEEYFRMATIFLSLLCLSMSDDNEIDE